MTTEITVGGRDKTEEEENYSYLSGTNFRLISGVNINSKIACFLSMSVISLYFDRCVPHSKAAKGLIFVGEE